MKLTELIKCLGNPEEITLLDYPRSRVSFRWAKVGRVKLIAMTRPRQWRRWLIGNLLVQSNRAEGYLSGIAGKETASLPGGVLATTNPAG
jgi:hypothetical protein